MTELASDRVGRPTTRPETIVPADAEAVQQPVVRTAALMAAEAERRAARRIRIRDRILSILSPIMLLVLWQVCSVHEVIDRRFFPPPTEISDTFWEMIRNGELFTDVKATLTRMVVGLFLGGVPGIIIGVAIGLSRSLRAIVKPIISALFPIPKIAVLPLILLVFGLGEESKYFAVAIGVVFLITINTAAAVMQIESIYLEVGRNFGANKWKFFWRIAIPGAMPGILTGLQLGLTVSLLIAISTEFVAAKSGIGFLIWNSWQIFNVRAMYVGLIACAVLGLFFQIVLGILNRLLLPWRRPDRR